MIDIFLLVCVYLFMGMKFTGVMVKYVGLTTDGIIGPVFLTILLWPAIFIVGLFDWKTR